MDRQTKRHIDKQQVSKRLQQKDRYIKRDHPFGPFFVNYDR